MPNGEFDIFGGNWGVGIPAARFDYPAIVALIDATKHVELDQFYAGWDGSEEQAWDLVAMLCREHGFFYGTNTQNKITFAQLRMADIRDAGNSIVYPIPTDLDQQPSEGEGINQISGEIGATPWSKGVPYSVNVLGARGNSPSSTLRSSTFDGPEATLDMTTRLVSGIEDDLISIASNRAYGAPVLTIRVVDAGFAHGEFVRIGDPGITPAYFRDLDGNEISPEAHPRWFGMVVGKDPDAAAGTTRLTLLLTNWYASRWARLRAPSAQCSDANTGTSYPCVPSSLTYMSNPEDFEVGMPVELWRPDGVRRSGTSGSHDIQTIASVSTSEIVLDSAFSTAAQSGDVIRCAPLNDSISGTAEDGSDAPYTGYVAFVFMCADDRTLGPNDLEPHIYATGQS